MSDDTFHILAANDNRALCGAEICGRPVYLLGDYRRFAQAEGIPIDSCADCNAEVFDPKVDEFCDEETPDVNP